VVVAAGDLVCAECGREPRDDENGDDEWRAYLDVDDDLSVFCPECAEREFGTGRALTSLGRWLQGWSCHSALPTREGRGALHGQAKLREM
jgi:hypothetical protein